MSLAKKCIKIHEGKVNEKFGGWKKLKKLLKSYKKPKKVKKPKVAFDIKKAKAKQNKGFFSKLFKSLKLTESKADKMKALADYLKVDADTIVDNDYNFTVDDDAEYTVMTDSEADEALKEYIEESVWAFNQDFLLQHIEAEDVVRELGLESSYYDEDTEEDVEIGDDDEVIYTNLGMSLEEYVAELQGKYEDGNSKIKAIIGDFDMFVKDAENTDGRGHFLSGYDGEENESGDYYIYRTN